VARTEHALAELLAQDLSALDLVALLVDGIWVADHCCVVALGITIDGTKVPLALAEGATENATVTGDLLTGLRERGLDVTRPILVVIDGAELAAQQAPLVFTPLPATIDLAVPWIYDPVARAGAFISYAAILECHALPLLAPRLPAASLDTLADRLGELGRLHRLFRTEQALQAASDPESVAVSGANRRQPRASLVVRRSRAVSVWAELERDTLGHIVEAADLTQRIASMLRLAAEFVPHESDVALAAGLGPTDQVVEGRVSDLGRRNQASFGLGGRQALARAEPEDSVPAATLGSASAEIGQELAARVLRQFRASRR
jgi:hypothetical protein